MAQLGLILSREQYSNKEVKKILDRDFESFQQKDKQKDIRRMFRLYNDVFFDIPKEGEESHTTLILKSRDFVRDFVDPKDVEIFDLTEQIADLNARILELEIELISGSAIPDTGEIDDLVEEAAEFPDENNDGIDDRTQEFSQYGVPKNLIVHPSNDKLAQKLMNPYAVYYKTEHYGKQIYKFKKKLSGEKNRFVVYDGARGKTGRRFLVEVETGDDWNIRKGKWKSKNYEKIFKP